MLDVFFQPAYGKLYENVENGKCETFVYHNGAETVQHTYIKRPVSRLVDGVQYYDVTTPYGYGGPVLVNGEPSVTLIQAYYQAWAEHCKAENVIAEFNRFHLFDNTAFRESFPGECVHISDNVVRSLEESVDEMWMSFDHKVRKNVKKAESNCLLVSTDAVGEHLDEVLDIYYKTMERNDAKNFYYFDRAYFQAIIDTLPDKFMFFHVWHEDTIISTELVLCSERYVYSFLGGTLDDYYPMRPNDLLKYEIIKWSKETGHKAFILGGGYSGNDGIYRYKKAFAPGDDVPFYVGRMIYNEKAYARLVDEREKEGQPNANYFPLYRG